MTKKKTAVILATGINGLGAIRSLHKVNFRIITIAPSSEDLAALSNLSDKLYIISDNDDWESNTLKLLLRLNHTEKPAIIACSDRAADFLATEQKTLEKAYCLLTPGKEVTTSLNDKKLETDIIASSGVPIPKTLGDIENSIKNNKLQGINFPIIIKPRTAAGYDLINSKNIIIENESEWDKFYLRHRSILDKLIAQEIIEGDDKHLWVCNVTFNRSSELVSAFSFQRLGTMPSHYGVTSMALSNPNIKIYELCQKIGSALSYVGPAMIEFKYDTKTDQYIYIETNPRIGMCNWFDTSCGVNNVEACCLIAMNKSTPAEYKQTPDLLFWNVYGDFIARLENRENILKILSFYSSQLFTRKVWAVFLPYDIRPFIIHTKWATQEILFRVTKKVKGKLLKGLSHKKTV